LPKVSEAFLAIRKPLTAKNMKAAMITVVPINPVQ